MATPIFICGLPRSRTAWFSLVATTSRSICYHEPTADLRSFEALKDFWEDDRFEYVGISDSSLIMQMGRILEEIKPRTLIIRRDAEDSARSAELYMSNSGYTFDYAAMLQILSLELETFHGHSLVREIDFDELHDVDNVTNALRWLMPNVTFPKIAEMMHMNVQVNRDWAIEKAKRPHTNWHLDTSWRTGAHP